jgi:hypothetical protein
MTSQIDPSKIDTTYPIPGRDNDSQGFRTNFSSIKQGLTQAASEISILQAQKADLREPSIFENQTQAYSTLTGALVTWGGVGIGQDLFVGGNVYVSGRMVSSGTAVLTTGTIAPTAITTTSDITFSGTYGQPNFTLTALIPGHKTFRNSLSVGVTNRQTGTALVYIGTTVTNQTGIYIRANGVNNGTALILDTASDTGAGLGSPDFSYIKFNKSPSGVTATIATIILDDATSSVKTTGNWIFSGNLTVGGTFQSSGGASYPPTNNSSIGSFVLACANTGTIYTPGTSTTDTLYRVGRFVPAGAPNIQYTLNPSTTLTLGGSTILPYYEGMPIRFDDVPTSGTWLSLALIHTCWYYTANRTTFTATSVGNPVYLWVRIA